MRQWVKTVDYQVMTDHSMYHYYNRRNPECRLEATIHTTKTKAYDSGLYLKSEKMSTAGLVAG